MNKPDPLTISRLFPAPCDIVFRAWSSAAHLKNWFCPEGLSIPEAELDFRPGGKFILRMREPDGAEHWMRGKFSEIIRPARLVFSADVSSGGAALFNVHTIVTFTEEAGGTRMAVEQAYEIFDAAAQNAVGGAAQGWASTLNRLAHEVTRLSAPAVHGSFTLEREFAASPAQVFAALTTLEAKSKWFAGGPSYEFLQRHMDATPGGRELAEGLWPDGTISRFDAVYFEILPDKRVVYAYEMHLNGERISVSLATLELFPTGPGTKLMVTEQGSFLNGYADNGAREHGTNFLFDKMVESLAPLTSPARN